jgi:uncharacterized RDD family membrane protein YckC
MLDRTEPGHDKPRPIRRFLSRTIDLLIAWMFMVGLGAALVPKLASEPPLLLWIVVGAAWIPIEALFLFIWRTTPGKWLLNSRVEGATPITYWTAMDRTFMVFCWGLGCLIPGVWVVCCAVGYHDLTNTGTTRWDRGRFRMLHARLGRGRIFSTSSGVLILLACYSYLRLAR